MVGEAKLDPSKYKGTCAYLARYKDDVITQAGLRLKS